MRAFRCMATAVSVLGLVSVAAGQDIKREDLGTKEKLRILVDKVMQPEEGWTTKEWIVKETAEAGFNVFSPRRGHENLDEVRLVNEWCRKYGIFHMPWMRGTLAAPDGPEADGKRVLWAAGNEQPLYSACSDEFWEWTHRYIVEYAKMSAEDDRLMGVFLDYENYATGGKGGNLYGVTYEDCILLPFLQEKELEPPDIEPGERKAWLEENELHEEFAEYQADHWRMRCRKLREEVDEHDPTFQFCIYPAPGTPFMVEACYPEWATDVAPVILADPWVYGRPSRFLPQKEALEENLKKLERGMAIPEEAGIPYIYSGGIDPVVTGADPEFCGKNAVMISEVTGGYWIFYEGPKYDEDHPDYFHWFAWANDRIKKGQLQAWHEARETDEDWVLDVFTTDQGSINAALPEVTGERVEFPKVFMRRENLLIFAARKGQPVEIELENIPVANYKSLLAWELRQPNREKLAAETIPHGETGVISFTPEMNGLHLLGASAGACAYRVVSANVPVGLFAADGVSFIYTAERMYFSVPEGVDSFSISATGWGAETVRVNVYDPQGEEVATGQTTLAKAGVTIEVETGGKAGTWSLETAKADEGVVEDNSIKFSKEIPPVLALAEEHVFGQ